MFRLDADRPVEFCDGLRRRDFLHAGALSFLGLGLPQVFELQAQGAVDSSKKDVNCIHLMLVGGPSQLDKQYRLRSSTYTRSTAVTVGKVLLVVPPGCAPATPHSCSWPDPKSFVLPWPGVG